MNSYLPLDDVAESIAYQRFPSSADYLFHQGFAKELLSDMLDAARAGELKAFCPRRGVYWKPPASERVVFVLPSDADAWLASKGYTGRVSQTTQAMPAPSVAPINQRASGGAMILWKLWLNLPQIELWQAVALVLNIEPRSLKRSGQEWMAGPGLGPIFEPQSFPSATKRDDFNTALDFAERATNVAGPIHLRTGLAVGINKLEEEVSLPEVVAYFVSCDWPDIPAPLLELGLGAAEMPMPRVVAPLPSLQGASEPAKQTYITRRRNNHLAAVITIAKKQAADPSDWHSVWASLVALAQSTSRPPPLLGYTDGEGVKYQIDHAEAPVGWLTRDALRKRLTR